MRDGEESDCITGLKQKTHYGRPDWNVLFDNWSRTHSKKQIGVFVCGPQVISDKVLEACDKCTHDCTKFKFNKENFWSENLSFRIKQKITKYYDVLLI